MKLSVIVPIYNVEQYLPRCIESILAQTHKDLEIILVDDGSPDDCPAICDRYAASDPRIIVIHKPNGGLSDARNAGLEIATGEWLSFIDSDDWIEPNMYQVLLSNAIDWDARISVGAVSVDLETESGVVCLNPADTSKIICTSLTSTEAIRKHLLGAWSAWDKIYRKDVFSDIRYPVGEINEDEAIMLELIDRAHTLVYTNEVFYHYIQREHSITSSSFSKKKLAWMHHCRDNLQYIRTRHPNLEPEAAARYRGSLLWSLTEIALSDGDFNDDIRYMRSQLNLERKLFRKQPFACKQDRLRLFLLTYIPFSFYKTFIRCKRGL